MLVNAVWMSASFVERHTARPHLIYLKVSPEYLRCGGKRRSSFNAPLDRKGFRNALIHGGASAKVAQTLAGHHSARFTLDQYADVVPEQLEKAAENVTE